MKLRYIMVIIFVFWTHQALALRCGNDVIQKGDRAEDVRRKCGEPLSIEKWEEATRADDRVRGVGTEIVPVEEWTYNFGANQFIQYLKFKAGVLEDIRIGDKGFEPGEDAGNDFSNCGNVVAVGDRKLDVRRKCGAPTHTEIYPIERISRVYNPHTHYTTERKVKVQSEVWTYNFGSNYSLYFITLENGVVVKVERGDYGY